MKKETKIEEITRIAKEAGLSLSEVFRKANVPYNTVQNWSKSEPKAFETYDTLLKTIEMMSANKETTKE